MKIFLDSCVWFAAIISPVGGSAALINKIIVLSEKTDIWIIISNEVIAETLKNLKQKSQPEKLLDFIKLYYKSPIIIYEGTNECVSRWVKHIHPEDALIACSAVEAKCNYFATLDKKHFFKKETFELAKSMKIIFPGDLLHELRKIK
ncbi:MAG: hypothetical protein CEN91_334 [Candidatus Berkelbacteria bacterium Licking1014_85]|uniref:PIN domain-containing protein n=1 Tax=Candidatus Berkelbacteria bacterium Licking1014_85 TaxID=2017148 RepID=A0A554LJ81_9BACT|nr:MAG: hypothetical protein CEN91_334 [Candidatus Berkelbacteria bacterium Licking1014_85]